MVTKDVLETIDTLVLHSDDVKVATHWKALDKNTGQSPKRFRALLWTSLHFSSLSKNEDRNLKAACVGWLDQSEAKKEAGGHVTGRGDYPRFAPNSNSFNNFHWRGRLLSDTTLAAQNETRPRKKLKPDPLSS